VKILVTGSQGQVARCLKDRADAYPDLELVFAGRSGTSVYLDMASPETIEAAVAKVLPDVVLNAAAYTAVDQAEDEPDLAMLVNGTAPGALAGAAAIRGIPIIQISTDYVFDGQLDRPYLPHDPVNPLGVYGRTKLTGEEAVRAANPRHVIARTAWVYSPYGRNFYTTMQRLAETKDEISVVNDQIGNPTAAHGIADRLLRLCQNWAEGGDTYLGETVHLVGPTEMTWYDFAREIMKENAAQGRQSCLVHAITSKEYPTKAARPKNSRLGSSILLK